MMIMLYNDYLINKNTNSNVFTTIHNDATSIIAPNKQEHCHVIGKIRCSNKNNSNNSENADRCF